MADLTSDLQAALLATSEHFETQLRRVVRDELAAFRQHGDPDALLNAADAARLLGMSPAALRRAAERGRFPVPPMRVGRRLRWRRGDLIQLLARRQVEKASSPRRSEASRSTRSEGSGEANAPELVDRREEQASERLSIRRVGPT